jgi:hypothetical protein
MSRERFTEYGDGPELVGKPYWRRSLIHHTGFSSKVFIWLWDDYAGAAHLRRSIESPTARV